MKPETSKAFRLFSIFTLKDLRSRAMRSGKGCHVPGAPGGTFGGITRIFRGHIVYPLVRRCDAVVVVPGKVGEFARVFGARDKTKRAESAYPRPHDRRLSRRTRAAVGKPLGSANAVCAVIGHRQALHAPPVGQAVAHKIHTPHLVGCSFHLQWHALRDRPFHLLAPAHCQVVGGNVAALTLL